MRSAIAGGKWEITKVILAIISFIFFIYMLCSAMKLMSVNENMGREITSADYSSLSIGETVCGKVDNIIMQYEGDESYDGVALSYYLIKSDDDKVITFRTQTGSECDIQMQELLKGQTDEVEFRGYVQELKDKNKALLNLQRIAGNTLDKNNIKGSWSEVLIPQEVDITTYGAQIKSKAIIATFVGAGIMLLLTLLFLKKIVKNMIYSIYVAKGKIVSETHTKPEKKLEAEEIFEGGLNDNGYFYIRYEQEENKMSDEDVNNP